MQVCQPAAFRANDSLTVFSFSEAPFWMRNCTMPTCPFQLANVRAVSPSVVESPKEQPLAAADVEREVDYRFFIGSKPP